MFHLKQYVSNSTETCILPYVKKTTRASSMHEVGHLKLVLRDNPEGWDGVGTEVGRGIQDAGEHMCTHS